MNNIFYNIACGLIGVFLIVIPIYKAVHKEFKLIDVIMLLFSPLYLGLCVGGFFIPEDYLMIPIFVMLGLTLILILIIVLYSKKNGKK